MLASILCGFAFVWFRFSNMFADLKGKMDDCKIITLTLALVLSGHV